MTQVDPNKLKPLCPECGSDNIIRTNVHRRPAYKCTGCNSEGPWINAERAAHSANEEQ